MTENKSKIRYSVTMTKLYTKAMDQLVESGLYVKHQDVVKDALRMLFRKYGLKTFAFVEPVKIEEAEKSPDSA